MKLNDFLKDGVEESSEKVWNTPECAEITCRINKLHDEIKPLVSKRTYFDLDIAHGERMAFVEQKAYEEGFRAAISLLKEMFFK